ncbi:unnamed protein product [Albugo candida]|uniref:Uncharacterized protein n=1 Tax=Albugo candida TaxID=65357 RepID=A0A024GEJ0_9STRA|nr:unnamed protein product [Albugo candida]|eukprot:CCI44756.1 unnamed protein product [Albugo candida]
MHERLLISFYSIEFSNSLDLRSCSSSYNRELDNQNIQFGTYGQFDAHCSHSNQTISQLFSNWRRDRSSEQIVCTPDASSRPHDKQDDIGRNTCFSIRIS